MTGSVAHDTFTLEREFPVPPERVFAAFADLPTKQRWFGGPPDWVVADEHTLDFRVGGREHEAGGPPGGPTHSFDAVYHDIVENERIVYSYAMAMDGAPFSVSLTTIELSSLPGGSCLRLTEHGAYFEGGDSPAMRRHGTGELLDALGQLLVAA